MLLQEHQRATVTLEAAGPDETGACRVGSGAVVYYYGGRDYLYRGRDSARSG